MLTFLRGSWLPAGATFDAVVASEVIEHVSNVPEFCASLVSLTAPGGSLVISTINRTNKSYVVAIVGAEHIMGLLPKGTHQWERFITPGDSLLPISVIACASLCYYAQ